MNTFNEAFPTKSNDNNGDGVALTSMAHPSPPWWSWKRWHYLFWQPRLDPKNLVMMTYDTETKKIY